MSGEGGVIEGIPDKDARPDENARITYTESGTRRAVDVHTAGQGIISTNNSSTATLAGDAVFTGTSDDLTQYANIVVFVDSDVDGTLSMQSSTDNSNWDRRKNIALRQENGSGSVHALEVVARYFRIVYTNGSSAQAHFRLQVMYHKTKSGIPTTSPDQVVSKADDVQLVRVFSDPVLDVARSLYADKKGIHKFGFLDTVPSGSFADIWDYGNVDITYNWPTATEGFRVRAGGNVNDTSAGTGARTIQLVFLDGNGDEVQEQITLAGASASSSTSTSGRRVQRAWVDTAGTINGNNTGQIIIENDTTAEVVATIGAGIGQTEQSMYTIPNNFTGYLLRIHLDVASASGKDADVRMWQRRDAYVTSAPFGTKRIVRRFTDISGEDTVKYDFPVIFPELTDIWLDARATGGSSSSIDVDYDLILVKNEAPTIPQ